MLHPNYPNWLIVGTGNIEALCWRHRDLTHFIYIRGSRCPTNARREIRLSAQSMPRASHIVVVRISAHISTHTSRTAACWLFRDRSGRAGRPTPASFAGQPSCAGGEEQRNCYTVAIPGRWHHVGISYGVLRILMFLSLAIALSEATPDGLEPAPSKRNTRR